jgi:hypothetical protein
MMDWSFLIALAVVGGFLFLWRRERDTAQAANERLARDTRLYQSIKTGMREYRWRNSEQPFWKEKHGEKLFETAHLAAYYVDHAAESRVGFYFKDLDEYGLYGLFAHDGEFESYYRTDLTFQKEEVLAIE